eukprot:m.99731 g.99731  ORF g.99731 m.99731 type:complete len:71 (-) comp14913_c1_seq8:222-434(-)
MPIIKLLLVENQYFGVKLNNRDPLFVMAVVVTLDGDMMKMQLADKGGMLAEHLKRQEMKHWQGLHAAMLF